MSWRYWQPISYRRVDDGSHEVTIAFIPLGLCIAVAVAIAMVLR